MRLVFFVQHEIADGLYNRRSRAQRERFITMASNSDVEVNLGPAPLHSNSRFVVEDLVIAPRRRRGGHQGVHNNANYADYTHMRNFCVIFLRNFCVIFA